MITGFPQESHLLSFFVISVSPEQRSRRVLSFSLKIFFIAGAVRFCECPSAKDVRHSVKVELGI
jgi:hypothetical protein